MTNMGTKQTTTSADPWRVITNESITIQVRVNVICLTCEATSCSEALFAATRHVTSLRHHSDVIDWSTATYKQTAAASFTQTGRTLNT